MNRHLAASAVSSGRESGDGPAVAVATRTLTALRNTRTQPASSDRSLELASVTTWTHTLVLSGELTHRSAHALEVEIDRLCEEGVTGITLDLRELTRIDSIGVAVIAFRCGLCKRRGYDFALIPGPPSIHRAFEQADVTDMLPFERDDQDAEDELEDELAAPRLRALALSQSTGDVGSGELVGGS